MVRKWEPWDYHAGRRHTEPQKNRRENKASSERLVKKWATMENEIIKALTSRDVLRSVGEMYAEFSHEIFSPRNFSIHASTWCFFQWQVGVILIIILSESKNLMLVLSLESDCLKQLITSSDSFFRTTLVKIPAIYSHVERDVNKFLWKGNLWKAT